MALQKNLLTHKASSFQEKMTLASLIMETLRILPQDDARRPDFTTLLLEIVKNEINANESTQL